jgi:hypothetical protein
LDHKKFLKKIFLFLIIILSLFLVLVVKKCNFKILNLKESISDSINIQNDLKKNELNDYLSYKKIIYEINLINKIFGFRIKIICNQKGEHLII